MLHLSGCVADGVSQDEPPGTAETSRVGAAPTEEVDGSQIRSRSITENYKWQQPREPGPRKEKTKQNKPPWAGAGAVRQTSRGAVRCSELQMIALLLTVVDDLKLMEHCTDRFLGITASTRY